MKNGKMKYLLPLLGLLGWQLNTQAEHAMQSRKDATRQHVEVAHGILAWAQEQERSGKLTQAQAQAHAQAKAQAQEYASLFGPGDFYLEIQPNGLADQDTVNDAWRKLAGEKKWVEATKAFEAALAANPGDPRALAELGYAAYHADDLRKATATNAKALEAATDPQLKAQVLFNEGMVAEKDRKSVV